MMGRQRGLIRKKRCFGMGVLCLAIMLCCTGCWDMVEIEDRLFVLMMGIDREGAQFRTIYAAPDVTQLPDKPGEALKEIETTSKSLNFGRNEKAEELSQELFLGHAKAVLLGPSLLKDPRALKLVLDSLMRDKELDKGMYVMALEGGLDTMKGTKPEFNMLLTTYLEGISENSKISAQIDAITLEDLIIQMMVNDGTVMLPQVKLGQDTVQMDGAVLMRHFQMVAKLTPEETEAVRWLSGTAEGGSLQVMENGASVPFVYNSFRSKTAFEKEENETLYLNVNMQTKGNVTEYILGERLLKEEKIKTLESMYERQIESRCKQLIQKLQGEYGADVIHVTDYLQKYRPKRYESIQGDADAFAKKIVITPHVKVKITGIGTMK